MIESMIQSFLAKEGPQDVIFFTGNFAAHHAFDQRHLGLETAETHELMFDSLSALTQLLAYYFPDTLVLPSFGNTDVTSIDHPVADEEHQKYHEKIFDLWFQSLPGNTKKLK